MRWGVALLAAAILWLAFAASPYVAIWRLAAAVQAHDAEAVAQRINFKALSASLSRQTAAALASATAARADLSPRDRQMINDAAASLVDPIVSALLTPQTVIDVLDDGWPQGLDLPAPPVEGTGRGLKLVSLKDLRELFLDSDMHGFRTMLVALPPGRQRSEQFRLRLRLRGLSWRLVDIELPERLREAISRKLAAQSVPAHQ